MESLVSGIFRGFARLWSFQDPCDFYHEMTIVNLYWRVNPIRVFFALLLDFGGFFGALIGRTFGATLKEFLLGIPVVYQLILLVFVLISSLLFLILNANYEISAFYSMFRIKPVLEFLSPKNRSNSKKNSNSEEKSNKKIFEEKSKKNFQNLAKKNSNSVHKNNHFKLK